jgi:hypothetical protein
MSSYLLDSLRQLCNPPIDLAGRGPFLALVRFDEEPSQLDEALTEVVAPYHDLSDGTTFYGRNTRVDDFDTFRFLDGKASERFFIVSSAGYDPRLTRYDQMAEVAAKKLRRHGWLTQLAPITDSGANHMFHQWPQHSKDLWNHFVFQVLWQAKLLEDKSILDHSARFLWFPGDAFEASDAAVGWLAQNEWKKSKAISDGPFNGTAFRWKRKVCSKLTSLEYQFLSYFWNDGAPKCSATMQELNESVWRDRGEGGLGFAGSE